MRFVSNDTPKKKKDSHQFTNFGFSTILLTFVMMCVVTFGVLALITANSDLKLSKKVKEKSTGYYQAEETAYETLTQLDEILAEAASVDRAGGDAGVGANADGADTGAGAGDDADVGAGGDAGADAGGDGEYLALVEEAVTSAGIGTYEDGTVSFSVPITDTQSLYVVVTLNEPGQQGKGFYTITTWETVHNESTDIIDDGTMNLMQ